MLVGRLRNAEQARDLGKGRGEAAIRAKPLDLAARSTGRERSLQRRPAKLSAITDLVHRNLVRDDGRTVGGAGTGRNRPGVRCRQGTTVA
jgi:hypothetical protein